jgi:tetratricopeptide (TPR) repeat protein
MNGLDNTPRIMRRVSEPGICFVLLFAAAVSCCHAQSSSDCALPQGLQSHGSADSFTAWDSAGTWFAQRKDLRCATEAYNKALQLRPRSWRTLHDLGVVEVAQKRYAPAVLHLRRAVDLKPDSVDAHNALGMALKDSGQFGEAEKQFREILKTDPNSVEALNHLAEILAVQKLFAAAIGYWDKAVSLDPGNIDAAIARAVALSQNGDQNAATSSLQQIVKTHPHLAVAHFNLGTVYANQKSFRQAADEYREASRLSPADPEARLALAKCLVFLAEYAEAIPILKAYVLNHPKAFEPHYLLGLSYRGLDQYPQAEEQLRIAAAVEPDHADLQFNLGLVILRSGRAKEAVPHLQKAIQLDPAAEGPRLQLAIALKDLNETQKSLICLRTNSPPKELRQISFWPLVTRPKPPKSTGKCYKYNPETRTPITIFPSHSIWTENFPLRDRPWKPESSSIRRSLKPGANWACWTCRKDARTTRSRISRKLSRLILS